jgi:hypothetical protein
MLHPRLFRSYDFFSTPSALAGRKCMAMERLMQRWPFKNVLGIHHTISHIIVALAFPAIAVGVKSGSPS